MLQSLQPPFLAGLFPRCPPGKVTRWPPPLGWGCRDTGQARGPAGLSACCCVPEPSPAPKQEIGYRCPKLLLWKMWGWGGGRLYVYEE